MSMNMIAARGRPFGGGPRPPPPPRAYSVSAPRRAPGARTDTAIFTSVAAAHAAAGAGAALGRRVADALAHPAGAHLDVAHLLHLGHVVVAVGFAGLDLGVDHLLVLGLGRAQVADLGGRHALQVARARAGASGDDEQWAEEDVAHGSLLHLITSVTNDVGTNATEQIRFWRYTKGCTPRIIAFGSDGRRDERAGARSSGLPLSFAVNALSG